MKILFVILILFFSLSALSQNKTKTDSLKLLIQKEKNIEEKTEYIYALGDLFEEFNRDSAKYYYAVARDFAKQNNFGLGEARYASYMIFILNKEGKFQEAMQLVEEAVVKYKNLNSPRNLSIAYLNAGNQWQYFSDFMTASEYYLKAKKIADSLQNTVDQRTINANLGSVFTELKQYQKARNYSLEALRLAKISKDRWTMLTPLYNLAMNERNQENYEAALGYVNEFQEIADELGSEYDQVDALLAKGNIVGKSDVTHGISLLNSALAKSKEFDFKEHEMYAQLYLAEIYLEHSQYQNALNHCLNGIPLAKALNTKFELSDFYKKGSLAYEKLQEYHNALNFNRKFEELTTEIQLKENKNKILGIEAKYQFNQKEAQIKALNAEKETNDLKIKQKNILNFTLFGLLLLAGIIGFLGFKNYQNQQKIQEQKITRLETEKRLLASDSLLKGQEEERGRMARELHDGLGGLLSGVKFNLYNMKRKLIITEEDGLALENSLNLLDQSIGELRRISHNLMPETILNLGLDGALKDLIQSLQHTDLQIIYQSYDIENGLNKLQEIATYRIVQELIGNIIKHAEARNALVQIRKDENLLTITVEDDGKGFQSIQNDKMSGIGLSGIRARVDYWKGEMQIDSDPGAGTSVHISLPLAS
ncbi:MAG: sensor histidine kinase [Flavobacteriaceae bacterium]|nr:sensor histidine kinase [Flavobacteriaceae bacterium]